MEKFNFRFVDDPKNQNVGLTFEEIDALKEKMGLRFPKAYIDYLLNAGKNSNLFNVETNSNELQKIQKELRLELNLLNVFQNEEILCIKKNFEAYYFFNLSENKGKPTLYILSEICINENWNAFQKRITKGEGEDFVTFINRLAEREYGITITQHLKNIPLYIIALPIAIVFIVVAGVMILIEKIWGEN
ncbi:SMI1/KNR4 family protein [Chryseobacterium oranimense]|uniref:SMI1/KNR4 family protein n=1 Tax=Chryseobacterium oranimense TaxID=421058 RepID=UPI0022369BD4|nr:SMI1/KNR4 family protein [Chryseobacterium oranimense]